MKTVSLIIILSLFCLTGFTQNLKEQETLKVFSYLFKKERRSYLRATIDSGLITSIQHHLFRRDTLIRLYKINEEHYQDTLILSEAEKTDIKTQLAFLYTFQWTKEKAKNNGLKEFTVIANGQKIKDGSFVYTITNPIFLRNHTICIVHFDYVCGGLCGHGETAILIKKKGKWEYWDAVDSWYS